MSLSLLKHANPLLYSVIFRKIKCFKMCSEKKNTHFPTQLLRVKPNISLLVSSTAKFNGKQKLYIGT